MMAFLCSRKRAYSGLRAMFLAVSAAWLLLPATASAQATITPNYKDADLQQVIEAVGAITGKNFIIDPRVKAQVTMISSTPMSAEAFYEPFLSILQVYGFVAVPSGDVIKVLPDANAIVNPNQAHCGFPSRMLAGVGVMFYLLRCKCQLRRHVFYREEVLTVVALISTDNLLYNSPEKVGFCMNCTSYNLHNNSCRVVH